MTTHSDHDPKPGGSLSDEASSLDMPIWVVGSLVARLRRARWFVAASGVLAFLLLISQRLTLPEAALALAFLSVAALLAGASPPKAMAVSKTAKPRDAALPSRRPSFEQMISSWPQPVVLVDDKQVIRTINQAAADLLNLRKAGDPLSFRLRDPDLLAAVDDALNAGREGACTLFERVPSERRLKLHVRPFSYSGSSDLSHVGMDRTDGEGPVPFVLLIIEDQTAEHLTEQMRSDFVANASHELRTPLASITGCIETLQGPAREDPKGQARFLDIMSQQATRMRALIDDLLSLNRIEMRAHRQPTDLVDLQTTVGEAVDLVGSAAEDAHLKLVFTPSSSPATVQGDLSELRQVVINLLQNAIKYGAGGDHVEITLRDALEGGSRMVELEVRDYGDGIAAEHLPRLTERFYRAHTETNPLATGTGLGLAIVKHIVARHRGRLMVDSEPGEGASFRVRLPYLSALRESTEESENKSINQIVNVSQD
ncbi:MAG: ATP-binding protein [Pseudomonadota bacterium]